MLESTFCHLDGIGAVTEYRLWERGICSWSKALKCLPTYSKYLARIISAGIPKSIKALEKGNSRYFADKLSASDMWRIWKAFRSSACFFDIETTGLPPGPVHITVAALCDREHVEVFVQGENLHKLTKVLSQYKTIVTFNGSSFDLPVVANKFHKWKCRAGHIDLRYPAIKAGYQGTLKEILSTMGLSRQSSGEALSGWIAPVLWHEYRKHKNSNALESLKAYAVSDVIHLMAMGDIIYNDLVKRLPISQNGIKQASSLANKYSIDQKLVSRLKSERLATWSLSSSMPGRSSIGLGQRSLPFS